MRVGFGDFLFDGEARELRRGPLPVGLSPKAFELLGLLLEARPRALSRQEIHDRLWPGTHVTHTSLPRVVNELRRAIGDDARAPRWVRTVHGYGYAFTAHPGADEATDSPVPFSVRWGGRLIPLAPGDNLIGRSGDCAVRIDSPTVSRRHARIRVRGAAVTLEDLGSRNGTRVRSRPVHGEVPLAEGDEIEIGPARLLLQASGPGSAEDTRTAVSDYE